MTAFAHGGSTDEYGGHVDWDNGEYHYHHGYPAHSHDGGYCPYEFEDDADHTNNGYSLGNSSDYNYGDRTPYLPEKQYPLVSESESTSQQTQKPISSIQSTENSEMFLIFILLQQLKSIHYQDYQQI